MPVVFVVVVVFCSVVAVVVVATAIAIIMIRPVETTSVAYCAHRRRPCRCHYAVSVSDAISTTATGHRSHPPAKLIVVTARNGICCHHPLY